ncbi:nuclear transport factor 2 family protein [Haliea sp. E1-2-M8]|uniref:nuclear transport factor 2 family protein n=1 Tax=Haliea sp. E1-2-M8 TaxID=3064706 RepID=UPI0027245F05|nr:nuclear transport factor 2 family protein [Haliea sp. E1-2-M8]MDO8861539.1 nuclear transport factor 2 family protein [Haliea sp. E1-2-M8]
MTPTMLERPTSRFLPRAWLSVVLGLAIGLSPAVASAGENLQVKNEVIDLMLCYGEGTDAFGEPGNPDAFIDGLEIYQECFTEDAIFNLWPAGTDFNDAPLVSVVGPLAWAENIVDPAVPRNPVTGLSISRGQHMLTNFKVETKGRTGTLSAYLSATRTIFDPDPVNPATGAVTNVSVANGTYTLYVEKVQGKWMVNQLDLKLISLADYFTAD